MSTTSSTEIQQLKEFIRDRFNQLDNKIDEIKKDLKDISDEVKSIDKRLVTVETKVISSEQRLSIVESAIQRIPDLYGKLGELKFWTQIEFIIIAFLVAWFGSSGRF
ncbi:MAG: DUF1664 domain-containing protein [Xenococcus sp. (in: cyanobacteria)]